MQATRSDFWRETNWFAVQSRPNHETLGSVAVAKHGVEVFFPRVKQEELTDGAVRVVTKALFKGYFFARFCPLILFDTVRHCSGVLRVLGAERLPIPIEAEVVSGIKERVQEDGLIRMERREFQTGEKVSIEQGPLSGWMGRIERECDDNNRVTLLLDSIQQARVLIAKRWLSAVADSV